MASSGSQTQQIKHESLHSCRTTALPVGLPTRRFNVGSPALDNEAGLPYIIPMNTQKTKKCGHCGVEWPLENFYKDAAKPDGLNATCKKCLKVSHAARRKRLREEGRCKCGRIAESGFFSCEECRRAYTLWRERPDAKARRRSRAAAVQQMLKQEVFAAYGGSVCVCCGEDHMEFLTIDHIGGDGAEHREKINGHRRNGANLYRWLRRENFPPGFRVLCMNCNFALGHFGYCPHGGVPKQERFVGRGGKAKPTAGQVGDETFEVPF